MKEQKNVMCYGERFPLYTRDSRQMLDRAIEDAKIQAKLKKVIALLEQLLVEEPQEDSRPNGRAYRNRTPLQSRRSRVPANHRLSIPVENCDERCRRLIADSLREFETTRRCRESEASYAARNPHKKG